MTITAAPIRRNLISRSFLGVTHGHLNRLPISIFVLMLLLLCQGCGSTQYVLRKEAGCLGEHCPERIKEATAQDQKRLTDGQLLSGEQLLELLALNGMEEDVAKVNRRITAKGTLIITPPILLLTLALSEFAIVWYQINDRDPDKGEKNYEIKRDTMLKVGGLLGATALYFSWGSLSIDTAIRKFNEKDKVRPWPGEKALEEKPSVGNDDMSADELNEKLR